MKNARILGLLLSLSFFSPQRLTACWQDPTKPTRVQAGEIKIRFTLAGKPLTNVFVMLRNRKTGEYTQLTADRDGWVSFSKVLRGTYKLVMDGPSHESFELIVDASSRAVFASPTLVYVSFTPDYCYDVRVREDHSEPTY